MLTVKEDFVNVRIQNVTDINTAGVEFTIVEELFWQSDELR